MSRRSERRVLHRQRRRGGSFTILQRGENVTLEVTRGQGKPVRQRMGQGTAGYYRALWEGEAALAFGLNQCEDGFGGNRELLIWND